MVSDSLASVNEFVGGVEQIKALAKERGRDASRLDFTVFGLEGQWQTASEIKALEKAGATRALLWLGYDDLKGTLREMERLARAVLD